MVWPVERLDSSVASLTRWASPPDSVGGGLAQLDIAQPHLHQGLEPPVDPGRFSKKGRASSTVISSTS